MPDPQIVAIGGGGDTPEQYMSLLQHVLSLTGKERPRIIHVPTATGDSADGIVHMYERLGPLCELSHLRFFPYPPTSLRELVDAGFPEGIAAEDGVGLHYVGTELREVVTCSPGATAYRVTRDGEERLEARELA